jgi:hypothetical protein
MQAGLEIARRRLALAELAAGRDDPAAAAGDLREAHRRFVRMGASRYVDRVRALVAGLPVRLDDGR